MFLLPLFQRNQFFPPLVPTNRNDTEQGNTNIIEHIDKTQLHLDGGDFVWTQRYASHQQSNATSNRLHRDAVLLHVLGDLGGDFLQNGLGDRFRGLVLHLVQRDELHDVA